jgi:hypothetical protein
MVADRLVGVWHLVYFEHIHPDGQTSYPFGFDISGALTYTPDDAMLMTIDPAADQAMTGDQAPDTAPSTLRFAGRYEVTETHILHHIETSQPPGSSGTTRRLRYAFSENRLVLSLEDGPDPGISSSIWERAQATD